MTLSGKTCVITGANSGLGFTIAKKIAAQNAETIIVCRNTEKGERAILEIKREMPNANVKSMVCDLSSIKSIQNFVKEFKAQYSKLDVLFNNAAVMRKTRKETEDGFEMMFQVNYLASFILMNSLLDQLKKGSSPQIINNGRPSYKLRLDMDDLQFAKSYNMYNSFFKTKLYLLFASLTLSQMLESKGITISMADPGPFKSGLVRDVPLMGWFKNLFSASVDKAAENIHYVITSEHTRDKNGKVFKKKQEWPLSEYWEDMHIRKELWSITESFVEKSAI